MTIKKRFTTGISFHNSVNLSDYFYFSFILYMVDAPSYGIRPLKFEPSSG